MYSIPYILTHNVRPAFLLIAERLAVVILSRFNPTRANLGVDVIRCVRQRGLDCNYVLNRHAFGRLNNFVLVVVGHGVNSK